MEVDRKVLLQLAHLEPFRLRDARELRLLNGRGGQRSRGKRLFQSVPAKDAQCPRPPVKGLSQLRKRAGQSGERRKSKGWVRVLEEVTRSSTRQFLILRLPMATASNAAALGRR